MLNFYGGVVDKHDPSAVVLIISKQLSIVKVRGSDVSELLEECMGSTGPYAALKITLLAGVSF